MSVRFSCTLYTICTLNMLYSNTLNITVTLSLCNYCQYSSAAHCTLSVHSICCTVSHSTLQSLCLSVTPNTNNIHPVTVWGSSGKKSTKTRLLFHSHLTFFSNIVWKSTLTKNVWSCSVIWLICLSYLKWWQEFCFQYVCSNDTHIIITRFLVFQLNIFGFITLKTVINE